MRQSDEMVVLGQIGASVESLFCFYEHFLLDRAKTHWTNAKRRKDFGGRVHYGGGYREPLKLFGAITSPLARAQPVTSMIPLPVDPIVNAITITIMSFQEGRKRLMEAFEDLSAGTSTNKRSRTGPNETTSSVVGPLSGVVICLTGFSSEDKTHLDQLVQRLGGRCTRELNLEQNTHLIAQTAQGPKYELAMSDPRIHIVTSSWLESCAELGTRVEEALHAVPRGPRAGPGSSPTRKNTGSTTMMDSETKPRPYHGILHQICQQPTRKVSSLFEFHQFYLLGFERDSETKNLLSQLIRRGKGTIHWELSNDITLLIVHDTCHEILRKACNTVLAHHPNLPQAVSPAWIIDSFQRNVLLPTSKYPPIHDPNQAPPNNPTATSQSSKLSLSRSNSMSTAVFRGLLFALSRVAPPVDAVDFDSKEQETMIKGHGGQLLTLKLMDAMKTDHQQSTKRSRNSTTTKSGPRRKCYVLCWGGTPRLELNPILSQLQRYNICDMILVTPTWLQTCISMQRLLDPSLIPQVFIPCPWPLKKLHETNLRVSVTGFAPTEMIAFSSLMKTCGITVVNDLHKKNTHLLCPVGHASSKIRKAQELGLQTVSIDWLYYIIQHGYANDESECDHLFAI